MPLTRLIRFHAEVQPQSLAIVDCAGIFEALTFEDLRLFSETICGYLQDKGIREGASVEVNIQDRAVLILVILALDMLGVAKIGLSPGKIPDSIGVVVIADHHIENSSNFIPIDVVTLRHILARPGSPQPSLQAHDAVLFFADNSSQSISDLFDRATVRLAVKQTSKCRAWLCAAEIKTELGLSCIFEAFSGGTPIGISSGSMEGDVQPAGLYGLEGLFVPADGISYFPPSEKASFRLRPKGIVVAGLAPTALDIEKIREYSPYLTIVIDLPSTGAIAASKSVSGDLCYVGLPGSYLAVLSSNCEQTAAGELGNLAVRSASVDSGDVGKAAPWVVTSINARVNLDNLLQLETST